jgi:hypothetical protein
MPPFQLSQYVSDPKQDTTTPPGPVSCPNTLFLLLLLRQIHSEKIQWRPGNGDCGPGDGAGGHGNLEHNSACHNSNNALHDVPHGVVDNIVLLQHKQCHLGVEVVRGSTKEEECGEKAVGDPSPPSCFVAQGVLSCHTCNTQSDGIASTYGHKVAGLVSYIRSISDWRRVVSS